MAFKMNLKLDFPSYHYHYKTKYYKGLSLQQPIW